MSEFRIPDYFRAGFDRAVASLPPEPVDTEADHAVAIERERIAARLDREAADFRHLAAHEPDSAERLFHYVAVLVDVARDIRNGEHWKRA